MKYYISILLFLVFFKAHSQSFEGIIEFESEIINVTGSLSFSGTIYLKNTLVKRDQIMKIGNITDSTSFVSVDSAYYLVHNNSIIKDKKPNRKIIDYDAEPFRLKQSKTKEKILGYDCTVYIEEEDNGSKLKITRYWIADTLKVNISEPYLLIKGLGVSLLTISETSSSPIITKIKSITPCKLDDSVFKLPDYPIEEKDLGKMTKQYLKD